MGGFIQAQAHAQLVCGLVDDGLDPQEALDRPRFRVEGDAVAVEPGLWAEAQRLRSTTGLEPRIDPEASGFGCGQAILRHADGWVAGSDSRRDGLALGF
jgi:gamma-glutamyltranspeptidase/glutathione hydrolase